MGEAELKKIPFFVRGKVRRNTEAYARDVGCREISSETLYDRKSPLQGMSICTHFFLFN